MVAGGIVYGAITRNDNVDIDSASETWQQVNFGEPKRPEEIDETPGVRAIFSDDDLNSEGAAIVIAAPQLKLRARDGGTPATWGEEIYINVDGSGDVETIFG